MTDQHIPQAPAPAPDLKFTKPQLLVVERMVIARCVRSTPDRLIFRDLLRPDDFTEDTRAWIFKALGGLRDCDPIIARSICERASGPNVKESFGESFADRCLAELRYCIETADALDGQSTACARQYATDLRDAAIVRRLVECSARAIHASQSDAVSNWGEWIQKFVAYVDKTSGKRLQTASTGPESIAAVADAFVASLAAPEVAAAAQSVGSTRLQALNQVVGPFQRTEVVAIAGEPGSGKSSLALQVATDLATRSRTLVFTLEMKAQKQLARLVSSMTGINGRSFKFGTISQDEQERASEAARSLSNLLVTFKELPSRSYEDMVATVRAEHAVQPVDVVVVDYLQLMNSNKRTHNRAEEVRIISNGLKALAMELDLCVIAIVAINRDAPKENRPPAMHDLRECGVLEYDAATVMALWQRPEESGEEPQRNSRGFGKQYGSQTMRRPTFGPSNAEYRPVELHMLKQRDGEKGAVVQLYFWPKYTAFSDFVPNSEARQA